MTNQETLFVTGVQVALCETTNWGPRRIQKRVIGKTHANGRFQLVGSDQFYRPERYRANRADVSPKAGFVYGRQYIEIWTKEHDAEIAQRATEARVSRKLSALQEGIQNLKPTWTTVLQNEETFNHIGLCMVAMAFAPASPTQP